MPAGSCSAASPSEPQSGAPRGSVSRQAARQSRRRDWGCRAGRRIVTPSVLVPVVAMASFVTEVLAHSGRLEKEDLGTRISRLTRRVEEIKVKAGRREAD